MCCVKPLLDGYMSCLVSAGNNCEQRSVYFINCTNYVKSVNEHIRSSIFSFLCRFEKSDNLLFVNYFHTY